MGRLHEAEGEMSSRSRASAVDVVHGNEGGGGGGGNRRSGIKPDQGNAEMGGSRRSRRETPVDESRKEMVDKVARHQAD